MVNSVKIDQKGQENEESGSFWAREAKAVFTGDVEWGQRGLKRVSSAPGREDIPGRRTPRWQHDLDDVSDVEDELPGIEALMILDLRVVEAWLWKWWKHGSFPIHLWYKSDFIYNQVCLKQGIAMLMKW